MPSYPTAVYSPSAKATGQVIQANHFNDSDAEITAIEDGLLNGLQHGLTISTGGLTVSTGGLRVGGGSTFHNGLTVLVGDLVVGPDAFISGGLHIGGASSFAGAVVFSGAVTFNGTITGFPLNPPRVRVTMSTTVAASSAFTGLNWNIEDYDSHAMHSTSVDSSRLTFVGSTGIYHVGGSLDIVHVSSGVFRCRILVNDSTAAGAVVAGACAVPTNDVNLNVSLSGDIRIASLTDYATLQVQGAGGTIRPLGNAVSAFWARHVST